MQLNPPSSGFASAAVFLSASLWGLYWVPLRYLEGQGVDGTWAVAIGVLTGFGLALYASGLVYSSVVGATLLFYLTPVWATLIGMVWLGEKGSWQRWAAIGGGLGGVTLLVSGGGSVPLNIGDLICVFLCCVLGLRRGDDQALRHGAAARHDDVSIAFTALGAIVLGHVAGLVELPSEDLVARVMPTAALVSIGAILPAVWVPFWAQKFLFPGRVGLLMMSEVLTAVISASLFLPEERMSAIAWIGAELIIGACLVEVFLTPQWRSELN